MTADEFSEKLAMLGALEPFQRNLWYEWQQTLGEHLDHMNLIGVDDVYGYVFMAFKWTEVPEGFEYWYAVANGFGRKQTTLTKTNEPDTNSSQDH
jgi:hypothetical protein